MAAERIGDRRSGPGDGLSRWGPASSRGRSCWPRKDDATLNRGAARPRAEDSFPNQVWNGGLTGTNLCCRYKVTQQRSGSEETLVTTALPTHYPPLPQPRVVCPEWRIIQKKSLPVCTERIMGDVTAADADKDVLDLVDFLRTSNVNTQVRPFACMRCIWAFVPTITSCVNDDGCAGQTSSCTNSRRTVWQPGRHRQACACGGQPAAGAAVCGASRGRCQRVSADRLGQPLAGQN